MSAALQKIDVSDRELITKFLRGDLEGLGGLVDRYDNGLRRFLFKRLWWDPRFSSFIDDVKQDTWVEVQSSLKGFKFHAKFSTWLYRIARRVVGRHRHRLPRESPLKGDWLDKGANLLRPRQPCSGLDPVDELQKNEAIDAVRTAIDALSPRAKAIMKSRLNGDSPEVIAQKFGIKSNAVKSSLARTKKTLRSALRKFGPSTVKEAWSKRGK